MRGQPPPAYRTSPRAVCASVAARRRIILDHCWCERLRKGSMMATILPDPATPFGERVAQRLREEVVIWLTTTGADGTPQPAPVWFLWEGETFLIYTLANAK